MDYSTRKRWIDGLSHIACAGFASCLPQVATLACGGVADDPSGQSTSGEAVTTTVAVVDSDSTDGDSNQAEVAETTALDLTPADPTSDTSVDIAIDLEASNWSPGGLFGLFIISDTLQPDCIEAESVCLNQFQAHLMPEGS